ncbi:Holliday junction resolvase RuvX [Sediminitomix flava]|uniref:Putative pre-16S rRNA nuclease n=1 Tax=Sediminitomix flava TaxID=379075 RepID=A0A315ZFZ6_SEDFL|nr:Holliday junction resolvase RuvX [Sediminitomix flava]PWJ44515.1 putative Holliday junction resolvase [Sediminitomix flava]
MGRIVGIDYGLKRTGLAATDPMQIIASAIETVPTENLIDYLKKYLEQEPVDAFVLGHPKNLDNTATDSTSAVMDFKVKLEQTFNLPVHLEDERYTSKMAMDAMIRGGMKKKDRRQKGNLDKLSAVIILQSYMESKGF